MLPKGGCGVWLLTTQKPINSPGWQKGKFALFQMLATASGEGGRNLFKGRHPSLDKQEDRLLQADCGGGVLHVVLSNSHLQIGYQWSDQHHLECFRYSSSSAPGSSCSHFFAVNSQNCGSLTTATVLSGHSQKKLSEPCFKVVSTPSTQQAHIYLNELVYYLLGLPSWLSW